MYEGAKMERIFMKSISETSVVLCRFYLSICQNNTGVHRRGKITLGGGGGEGQHSITLLSKILKLFKNMNTHNTTPRARVTHTTQHLELE